MSRRCTVPLLAILALALAVKFLLGSVDEEALAVSTEIRAYRQFREAISRQYVEEVPPEDIFFGALQGMTKGLDDYSQFLAPDQYEEMMHDTEGEFGGLGIEIFRDQNGRLAVHTPLVGTPAAKAGIQPGDVILRILRSGGDGPDEWVATDEVSTHEAVRLLKGPPGTEVTIEVVTEGATEPRRITIERAVIEVPSVQFTMILPRPGKVGYVDLAKFQDGTADDLARAVDDLLADGMRALILDLRHNPGGTLDAAEKVADLFIAEGIIVSIRERDPERNKVCRATKEGTYPGFPMAILIEGTSASASEIVAAALQDHHRATLVGQRTFGKGSVQSIMPIDLGDYGRAALKITSARYYTPKGVCINREPEAKEWGVAPDIEARVPKEERRRHWEDRSKAWVELNSARDGDELPDWPKGPQLDRAYEHLMKVLGGEPAREEALPAAGAGDAPE